MHVSMSKLFQREHSSHQDNVKPLFLYPKDPQIHIIFQCLYRWILTFVCSLFSPLEILMVSSSLLLPPCWSSARSLPVTASAGLTVTETWKGSSVQLPFLESWLFPIHMQRGPKRLTAAQAGGRGASGGQTAAMAPLTQSCVFTALPSASSQRGPYEVSWGVGWGGGDPQHDCLL